ncbi:DUF1707 SHOCT-like domain-containing protein [Nocardia sp. NPDC004722]
MSHPQRVRVSALDRQHALQELAAHLSVGRLTLDEFEDLSAEVWRAETIGALARLFVDLPAPPQTSPPAPNSGLVARRAMAVGAIGILTVALYFLLGTWMWPLLAGPVVAAAVVGLRAR